MYSKSWSDFDFGFLLFSGHSVVGVFSVEYDYGEVGLIVVVRIRHILKSLGQILDCYSAEQICCASRANDR